MTMLSEGKSHWRPRGDFAVLLSIGISLVLSTPYSGQSPGNVGKVYYPQDQGEAAKKNFDGDHLSAKLQNPSDILIAPDGSIYVSDGGHNTIRKIDAQGNVRTFAGNAIDIGNLDGKAALATFANPSGMAFSNKGDIYVVNHSIPGSGTIRKITPAGDVTTLRRRLNDGTFEDLHPRFPNAIAVGKDGTLFISESTRVMTLNPEGNYSILAGHETEDGCRDGIGPEARFGNVISIVVTTDGNLLVSDKNNHVIRKVTTKGEVTTLAGKPGVRGHLDGSLDEALFSLPVGITLDSFGDLIMAELGSGTIRKICRDNRVITIAGTPEKDGFVDGPGDKARFNRPTHVAVDASGNIFVVDCFNNAIRKISKEVVVTTLVGKPDTTGLKGTKP